MGKVVLVVLVVLVGLVPYVLDTEASSELKKRVKRQQEAPPRSLTLNPPIPTSIGHYLGSSQKIDACERDEVFVADKGGCHRLLTQGPCGLQEEVLLDPETRQGYCAPRLCPPDRIFIFSDQLCHDPRTLNICPPGRELFKTAYGTPVCQCPDGTYEGDDDLDDDVCDPILGQSLTCMPGQVLWFRDFSLPPECLPDPCGGVNINRGPNDLPFVPSATDGKCYQLGQSGGVCPAKTWYSLALENLKGVCTDLEDAGYQVFDQNTLDQLTKIYGPPIPRETTNPISVPTTSSGGVTQTSQLSTTGAQGSAVGQTGMMNTGQGFSGRPGSGFGVTGSTFTGQNQSGFPGSNPIVSGATGAGQSQFGASSSGPTIPGVTGVGQGQLGSTATGSKFIGATGAGQGHLGSRVTGPQLSGATGAGQGQLGSTVTGPQLSGATGAGQGQLGSTVTGPQLSGATGAGQGQLGSRVRGQQISGVTGTGQSQPGSSIRGPQLSGAVKNQQGSIVSGSRLTGATSTGHMGTGQNQFSSGNLGSGVFSAVGPTSGFTGATGSGQGLSSHMGTHTTLSGSTNTGFMPNQVSGHINANRGVVSPSGSGFSNVSPSGQGSFSPSFNSGSQGAFGPSVASSIPGSVHPSRVQGSFHSSARLPSKTSSVAQGTHRPSGGQVTSAPAQFFSSHGTQGISHPSSVPGGQSFAGGSPVMSGGHRVRGSPIHNFAVPSTMTGGQGFMGPGATMMGGFMGQHPGFSMQRPHPLLSSVVMSPVYPNHQQQPFMLSNEQMSLEMFGPNIGAMHEPSFRSLSGAGQGMRGQNLGGGIVSRGQLVSGRKGLTRSGATARADLGFLEAPKTHKHHEFLNSVKTIMGDLLGSGTGSQHHRARRSPLPHALPGNVFQTRLVGCRAGAVRDINAKCRNTILPARPPVNRPTRAAPPVPPNPRCGTGLMYNLRRNCVSANSAVNSINAFNLG